MTTAVQADLDHLEALSGLVDTPVAGPPSSGPIPRQRSRDAGTSTVSIQGSGNHYHPCADDDYPAAGSHDDSDVGFDPSILPPPDPWIDAVEDDPGEATQAYVCQRDGHWFLKLLRAETERMEGWCRQMQQEELENDLPDESQCPMMMTSHAHCDIIILHTRTHTHNVFVFPAQHILH